MSPDRADPEASCKWLLPLLCSFNGGAVRSSSGCCYVLEVVCGLMCHCILKKYFIISCVWCFACTYVQSYHPTFRELLVCCLLVGFLLVFETGSFCVTLIVLESREIYLLLSPRVLGLRYMPPHPSPHYVFKPCNNGVVPFH